MKHSGYHVVYDSSEDVIELYDPSGLIERMVGLSNIFDLVFDYVPDAKLIYSQMDGPSNPRYDVMEEK